MATNPTATKLVIVEGIPGSGKSTTARFVAGWLAARGLSPRLHLEGDLDHPADYESVARLTREEFARLLQEHASERALLEQRAMLHGDDVLIGYRKLQNELGERLPADLFTALARHEIYEQPLETYCRLAAAHWQEFAGRALAGSQPYVFECCFLQNPLCVLLARDNRPFEETRRYILDVAQNLEPLDPLIVYLDPPNIPQTFERMAAERPKEWLDFVIWYNTGQAWGRDHGQSGFDGMVRFYETRRDVERALFEQMSWKKLWVENAGQDWPQTQARLAEFLEREVA